jgi:hypothetical protein
VNVRLTERNKPIYQWLRAFGVYAREWFSLDGTPVTEQRFYWAWIAATTGYGVGDVVTTIAIVTFASGVTEGNPIVASGMSALGLAGLVAIKIAVLVGCLGISQYSARLGEPILPYVLPSILAVVGASLTGYNVWLMGRFG